MSIEEPSDEGPKLEWSPEAKPPVLDYQRPFRRKNLFGAMLNTMILISIGWLFPIFFIYALVLDGGNRLRRCEADYIAYLFVAAIILIRRGRQLTNGDLAFIGFGYPMFILITEPLFQ